MRIALASLALTVVATLGLARAPVAVAMPMDGMSSRDMSHGRYNGAPDLALTSAMLAAGGGATNFHSARLFGVLTAQHANAEVGTLESRFGKPRMVRFFVTFDSFIHDAVVVVTAKHVALPPPNPALATNAYELAASLRRAGVMPDGRFDIGYFVERLVSRPVHVQVMHDVDASATVGHDANADFHIILTSAMNDLKTLYHLSN